MEFKDCKIVIVSLLILFALNSASAQEYEMNLAAYADVFVSDEHSYDFSSFNAVDRKRGTDWVSKGSNNKWILLNWPYAVNIYYIKVINRMTGTYAPIHHSELSLSDGTVYNVGGIQTHGRKLIEVNKDGITWVRFHIKKGLNNVGLNEIIVVGE